MLVHWQKTIVDRKGNVAPGSVVVVRRESNQALARVYKDQDGLQPYPTGSVTADENGYVSFYAAPDLYRITSLKPDVDWRNENVGFQDLQLASVTYLTKSEMEADTGQPVPTLGAVVKDPDEENNAFYVWDGTEWSLSSVNPARLPDIQAVADAAVAQATAEAASYRDQAASSANGAVQSATDAQNAADSAALATAAASSYRDQAAASATGAGQSATNAQASAVAAAQSTTTAASYRNQTIVSASEAAQSAADARAAAEASGDRMLFDTHADAVAALADIPEGTAAEIFADELNNGAHTLYVKESGALVFKLNLDYLEQRLAAPTGPTIIGAALPYTGLAPLTQAMINAGIPLTPTWFGAVNDGSKDNADALLAFASALAVKLFWGKMVGTNSLGRFAIGPNIPSELGQFTTAIGEGAGVGATSTNSDGTDRAPATAGNTGAVEKADFAFFGGNQAGFNSKSHSSTMIGNHAGYEHEGYAATLIGQKSGKQSHGTHYAGLGYRALNDANGHRKNGHGYVSGRFSFGDDCVYYGYFSGYAQAGSFSVFHGNWSGHAAIGDGQVAIGDKAGRAMIGDGPIAIGQNATCRILNSGDAFVVPASDIDISLSRFRVPTGTAAALGLDDLDYVSVLWNATDLTNRPIGIGSVLFQYRFMLVLDEGEEFFAGTTNGGDEGGWTQNPAGPPIGTVTGTPYRPAHRAIAIGRNALASAENAIAIGDGVTNGVPNSIQIGNSEHAILRTAALMVAKGYRLGAATTAIIQDGAITITHPGRWRIDTEGGAATDELVNIYGGTDGDVITLTTANNDRDITLRDGIGTIGSVLLLPGNISMSHTQTVVELLFDSLRGGWLARSVSLNNT